MTTGAILSEDEPFRRIADAVRAVAIGADDAGNPATLREMTALFELRELLLVTVSAHHQSHICIGLSDEFSRMGLGFVALRGVAPVTAGTINPCFAVSTGEMDINDLGSAAIRLRVTSDAVVTIQSERFGIPGWWDEDRDQTKREKANKAELGLSLAIRVDPLCPCHLPPALLSGENRFALLKECSHALFEINRTKTIVLIDGFKLQ
jgi:hypothetical protein